LLAPAPFAPEFVSDVIALVALRALKSDRHSEASLNTSRTDPAHEV
jgi:hypothetical protein